MGQRELLRQREQRMAAQANRIDAWLRYQQGIPVNGQIEWVSEYTSTDVEVGRAIERQQIAEAEAQAASRRTQKVHKADADC